MSIHGEFVSDESKQIRRYFDEDGNCVRILLIDDLYDRLMSLLDPLLRVGNAVSVSIEEVPYTIIETFRDWYSALVFKFGAFGMVISFHLVLYFVAWIKGHIRFGKFTYKNREYDQGVYGTGPYGLVPMVCELPVEG